MQPAKECFSDDDREKPFTAIRYSDGGLILLDGYCTRQCVAQTSLLSVPACEVGRGGAPLYASCVGGGGPAGGVIDVRPDCCPAGRIRDGQMGSRVGVA